MDQIAQNSGFGKATLYYYFKSKEDVFSAILEDGWENIWESLEPIIADEGSPRNSFIKLLMKIAEIAQERERVLRAEIAEAKEKLPKQEQQAQEVSLRAVQIIQEQRRRGQVLEEELQAERRNRSQSRGRSTTPAPTRTRRSSSRR